MYQLDDDSYLFPPVSEAMREPNGLLAIGGDLSSKRLQAAYYDGIFPWFNPGEMPLWWSPDPRAVLMVGELHISRSMKKVLKSRLIALPLTMHSSKLLKLVLYAKKAHGFYPKFKLGIWHYTKQEWLIPLKLGMAINSLEACMV